MASEPQLPNEALDLESAIGDAFKELTSLAKPEKDDKEHENFSLEAAIGDAFKNILPANQTNEKPQDDYDIDSNIDPEIQAQSERSAPETEKPQLEDANTQTQNEQNEPVNDDALADAIGEAFKSIGTLPPKPEYEANIDLGNIVKNIVQQISGDPEDELALEKLQMNEVFQNAMSMATEKPKELTIAETLALHRSEMKAREEVDKTSLTPQVLSILSSLSNHIHSRLSQSVIQVIRQMTTEFMNTKAFTLSSKAKEILKEVNDTEAKMYFNTMVQARAFLSVSEDEGKRNAVAMLDNVIGLLHKLEPVEFAGTGNYYDLVYTSFSSVSSSRLRNVTFKSDLDSEELKEQIRIGNRERKKKWREVNSERNKDVDLRARVIRRATLMFGETASAEKDAWVEEEFRKRREKRIQRTKASEKQEVTIASLLEDPSQLEANPFHKDPAFAKFLANTFHLVAESGFEEDAAVCMAGTAAAVASAAASYAVSVGAPEVRPVQAAMAAHLNALLDLILKGGHLFKVPFLAPKTEKRPVFESTRKKPKVEPEEPKVEAPLRMPLYKSSRAPTPFILNKASLEAAPRALKKPGSFRRPNTVYNM